MLGRHPYFRRFPFHASPLSHRCQLVGNQDRHPARPRRFHPRPGCAEQCPDAHSIRHARLPLPTTIQATHRRDRHAMHPTSRLSRRPHLRRQILERLVPQKHALAEVRSILFAARGQLDGEAAAVPARL